MIDNKSLDNYCAKFLNSHAFKDYSPNGLQVEGKPNISRIVCGVSANLALIERAITDKADAIFVHHGFFWQNESRIICGAKRRKIALLLQHNINLFGYHLPLDAHSVVGNNIQLGKRLNIQNPARIDDSLVWQGKMKTTLSALSLAIEDALKRKPLVIGDRNKVINKIAWCTGGAQNYIDQAIEIGADAYISGEISEQTPATALENNIAYLSAGHHATERYGVQALCAHLAEKFNLKQHFVDIDNPV